MDDSEDARRTKLTDLCTADVACVGESDTLADALQLMQHRNISCVVVTRGRRPVGIFTDRDALAAVADGLGRSGVPISTRMTPSPITCPPDTPLLDGYSRMASLGIRHLLLVDAGGDLVGIVTESDFVKALLPDDHLRPRTVDEVMQRSPATVGPDEPIEAALHTMLSRHISSVVVVRAGMPLGILTERDAYRVNTLGDDIGAASVASVMSTPVLSCTAEQPLATVSERMQAAGVRRFVVVDAAGLLVGLVSHYDLVKHLRARHDELLRELMARQPREVDRLSSEVDAEFALNALLEQQYGVGILAADSGGRVRYVSRAARRMLPNPQVEGLALRQVAALLGADEAAVGRRLATLKAGEQARFDLHADGMQPAPRFSITGIDDRGKGQAGYLMLFSELSLEQGGEDRFRSLFAAAPLAMILHRLSDEALLHANQAAIRLFGYAPDDVAGHASVGFQAWRDDRLRARYFDDLRAGRSVSGMRIPVRRKDGVEATIELHGEPIVVNGEPCALGMFHDVTPQVDYLAQLERQQHLVSAVFESIPDALLVTTPEGRILLANSAVAPILAASPQELLGRDAARFLPEPDRRSEPDEATDVMRARGADGREFPAEISVTALRDDEGEQSGKVILIRDISERERRRRELMEHQARLQSLIDSMADWVWELDQNGRFTFVSARVQELLGYEPSELIGRSPYELMSPAEAERVRKLFSGIAARGEPFRDMLNLNRTRDGEERIFTTSGAPVFDSAGQIVGWRGTDRDITEVRRAEERLRESEERYRSMFESAGQPMVTLDPDGAITAANRAFSDLLHLAGPDDMIGRSPIDFSPEIQPDGLTSTAKADVFIKRAFSGELVRFEWQHLRPDKTPLPMEVALARIEWEGAPSVLATGYDLRDRYRAAAVERREMAMFESSAEGIMLTDTDNRIVAVNPAFSTITGYSAEEAIGNTPELLRSGRQSPEFYRAMWEELEATGRWQGEIWNRRKDGEVFPEWLSVSEIRGDDGKLLHRIGVFTDISQKHRNEAEIEQLTHYDPITELPNATLLRARLSEAMRSAAALDRTLALMLLNLDGFSRFVASFGHEAGDDALKTIAKRLRLHETQDRTLARLLGDTFAVLLLLPDRESSPNRYALLLQRILAKSLPMEDAPPVSMSACVGVAVYPGDAESGPELLRNADAALQRAKAEGPGTIAYYRPQLTEQAQRRIELESTLRTALDNGEFELFFQPKLDLKRRGIVAAEALIRWRRADGTLVSPGQFLPVIEGTSLMLELDRWVLRTTVETLVRLEERGVPRVRISANISAAMLKIGNLAAECEALLHEHGIDPMLLEVEVLENILIEDPDHADAEIAALSSLGISIALDDFGTGYASLGYLKRFAFDYLKIDRSFVTGLTPGSDDMAIIRATIVMAHQLGIRVVAEGVEREEQIRQLTAMGCDMLQGYRIGRPMPLEDLEDLLGRGDQALQDDLRQTLIRRTLLLSEDSVESGRAATVLWDHGWEVIQVTTIRDARALMEREQVDLILCDAELSSGDVMEFLAESRATRPSVTRLLLAGDVPAAKLMDAINQGGVFRCLSKPCGARELAEAMQAACERGLIRGRL